MNFKFIQSLIFSLLLFGHGAGHATSDQAVFNPDTWNVAETYFAALAAGDRQTLMSLLSGDELIRSESQLSDPEYSQFLINRYSSATLEIVGSGVRDGLHTVDIIIWLNDFESIKERLILQAIESPEGTSYRIVSREEFNN